MTPGLNALNVRGMWQDVKEVAQSLPAEVLMVTIPRRDKRQDGGVLVPAKRELAAKLIVDGTHQLANEEQIVAYKQHHATEGARLRSVLMQERSQSVLVMSPEMLAQMNGIVAPAVAAAAPVSAPAGKR